MSNIGIQMVPVTVGRDHWTFMVSSSLASDAQASAVNFVMAGVDESLDETGGRLAALREIHRRATGRSGILASVRDAARRIRIGRYSAGAGMVSQR